MKERLDRISLIVVYFYSVICIAGVYTCDNKLTMGIYEFINALSFNKIFYPLGGDFMCVALVFDYFNFLILGILITIRYLIFGKTYQK